MLRVFSILLFVSFLFFSCVKKGEIVLQDEKVKDLKVSFSSENLDKNHLAFIGKEEIKIVPVSIVGGFNIKVKKNTIFSKKVFDLYSIQDSNSVAYFQKIDLFQAALKAQKLIGLKSKFLNVYFQDSTATMFFQEGFDKRIIESNKNREGLLFTFSDQLNVEFCPKRANKDSIKKTTSIVISDWLNGKVNVECVFDLRKTAQFLSLQKSFDLLGSKNLALNYYLNPVSNLLEPFVSYTAQKTQDAIETKLLTEQKVVERLVMNSTEIEFLQNELKEHIYSSNFPSLKKIEAADSISGLLSCLDITGFNEYFEKVDTGYLLKSKNTIINKAVIIPAGSKIHFNSGDQVDFQSKGFIVSKSPVFFNGSQGDLIKVISTDSTGMGIHVINAGTYSQINYTEFSNQSNLKYGNWSLPSAVTFYESPVKIDHSYFINNQSEDGLNLFRSYPFEVSNTTFKNTFSDAFDADFSDGTLTNCNFINAGNDAIDISGSTIVVKGCVFDKVADKALSAGEDSKMTVDSIKIDGASLAVVAKDLSKVIISNSEILNSEVVYCAFQKKQEFGPSTIVANNVTFTEFKEENLIEEKSTLKVDGEKIHNYRDDVRKYLYGNEFGKETVK